MTLQAPIILGFIATDANTRNPFAYPQPPTTATAQNPTFVPPSDSLLVVGVAVNAPSAVDASLPVAAVTDTSGLTWTRRAWRSSGSGSTGGAGQPGTVAEIWTAVTGATPSPMAVQVAWPNAAGSVGWNLYGWVIAYSDDTELVPLVGAVAGSSSASGIPTVDVPGVLAGSQLLAVSSDWSALTPSSYDGTRFAALSDVGNAADHNVNFAYHCFHTVNSVNAGTATIAMAGPASQNYNMVALEIGSRGSALLIPSGWAIGAVTF